MTLSLQAAVFILTTITSIYSAFADTDPSNKGSVAIWGATVNNDMNALAITGKNFNPFKRAPEITINGKIAAVLTSTNETATVSLSNIIGDATYRIIAYQLNSKGKRTGKFDIFEFTIGATGRTGDPGTPGKNGKDGQDGKNAPPPPNCAGRGFALQSDGVNFYCTDMRTKHMVYLIPDTVDGVPPPHCGAAGWKGLKIEVDSFYFDTAFVTITAKDLRAMHHWKSEQCNGSACNPPYTVSGFVPVAINWENGADNIQLRVTKDGNLETSCKTGAQFEIVKRGLF